jgi:NAD+ synthase
MGRQIDIEMAANRLGKFISEFAAESGFSQVVLGISGGVDSSLAAALGAKALGSENVLGLIMPYRSSSPESEQDAMALASEIGIRTEKVEISPMVDAYFGGDEISAVRRGNKLARERMSILFDIAARDNLLVLGTSNKTEISLGYSTWYGDSACSLNPLGGLYKREVREMAEFFGIPRRIINKNPTADLWPGQTDEDELGISYDLADLVLYQIVEEKERSLKRLINTGADEKVIKLIVERINRFAFKRSLPAIDLLEGNPIPAKVNLTGI